MGSTSLRRRRLPRRARRPRRVQRTRRYGKAPPPVLPGAVRGRDRISPSLTALGFSEPARWRDGRRRMRPCSLAALILALLVPAAASGQRAALDPARMAQVFPGATRFAPPTDSLLVSRAYGPDPATGQDALLGYLFFTSDWPPL